MTDATPGPLTLADGDAPLRIDERPTVIVSGPVPAFREMSEGTVGRDVGALNRYLSSAGYDVDVDSDTFTARTKTAVRAWQADLGVPPSGTVRLGDVVFVASDLLDGRLYRLSEEVSIGASLAPASVLLERLEGAPRLTMEFGGSPPEELAPGQSGVASIGDAERDVVLGEIESVEGRMFATLNGPDETPVCQPDRCRELVPVDGTRRVSVTFTLVEPTAGPVVPTVALQTDAAGEAFVTLEGGSRQPVEIVVSSGGLAVVEGVNPGDVIVLP